MSSANRFGVYSRMTAKPGQRDALIAGLQEAIGVVDGNAGLEFYTINAVLDDPDAIWVTETWTDKLAHDTVERSDIAAAAIQRVIPLLAGPPASFQSHVVYLHDGRK